MSLKTKDGKPITKKNIEQSVKSLQWCSFNLGDLKELEPNTFPHALKVYIENAITILEAVQKEVKE